jgi:hypothetical protein
MLGAHSATTHFRVRCEKCNREFTKSSFKLHKCKTHDNSKFRRLEEWKVDENKYKCPFCDKIFCSSGICSHIWRMHDNEGIKFKQKLVLFKKGKTSWNKGLTKETSEKVKINTEKLKDFYKTHKGSFNGKTHSESTRKKLSEKAQKGIKEGT